MTAAAGSSERALEDEAVGGERETSFVNDSRGRDGLTEYVEEEGRLRQSDASKDETDDENEMETKCGAGSCRPSWLQPFARAEVYAVMHAMLGFIIFADATYFVGTLSTVEKHLQIPSRTTGFMHSSFEIGSMVAMPITGYVARHINPMRLLGCGTALVGFACLSFALPHFLFGSAADTGTLSAAASDNASVVTLSIGAAENLCGQTSSENCDSAVDSVTLPVIVFCAVNVLVGIGTSAHHTVGLAYLDNNSSKNKSPILLAGAACIQMLGSTLGFAVAAAALAFYVQPTRPPPFGSDDPRWIGAWWMGWPLMGVLTAMVGGVAALFPRRLPQSDKRRRQICDEQTTAAADSETLSLQDLKLTIFRLLKNKVLVFNTCSSICLMFGYASYWTFQPKYIETQYHRTASQANIITGSMSLVFSGVGMMATAIVVTRFKPGPRKLAGWNVLTEIVDVFGHFSWAFLGCDSGPMQGYLASDGSWNLTMPCNEGCNCGPEVKFAPVCSFEMSTAFFSPCHAGCRTFNNETQIFSDCACIHSGGAVSGLCSSDCSADFTVFLVMQCILYFLQTSGRSCNVLLAFRCVDEKDKSLSIALTQIALGILVFLPAPTFYGALLDSACLVWGETCGTRGNCWLYDAQKMRYTLNFTATGFLAVGVIFDIAVWLYSPGLKLYDEDM